MEVFIYCVTLSPFHIFWLYVLQVIFVLSGHKYTALLRLELLWKKNSVTIAQKQTQSSAFEDAKSEWWYPSVVICMEITFVALMRGNLRKKVFHG